MAASSDFRMDHAPVVVSAPHDWDGIGQALRTAFCNYRSPPDDLTAVLRQLDDVD